MSLPASYPDFPHLRTLIIKAYLPKDRQHALCIFAV